MKTFSYTILNGCLPCCGDCGVIRKMEVGDVVLIDLNQSMMTGLPVSITGTVASITDVGNKKTYVFSYNADQLVGTNLSELTQCFVLGYPRCKTKLDELEERIIPLEEVGSIGELGLRITELEEDVQLLETTVQDDGTLLALHSSQITVLQAGDVALDLRIDTLEANSPTNFEARMVSVEGVAIDHEGRIDSLETGPSLPGLQAQIVVIQSDIVSLQADDVLVDTRLDALEAGGGGGGGGAAITALQAQDVIHSSQILALQTLDTTHNGQIAALVATDVAYDSRLDALELGGGGGGGGGATLAHIAALTAVDAGLQAQLNDHESRVDALESGGMLGVCTFAELLAELALAGEEIIAVRCDIPVTANFDVPRHKSIVFNNNKLIQTGAFTINFHGELMAGRKQVFQGFLFGQIRGGFKNPAVFPDWWGLTVRTGNPMAPSNETSLNDDIAINCAISSFQQFSPEVVRMGQVVSLAAGFYFVNKPLDLTNAMSCLAGAGAGKTIIVCTTAWTGEDFANEHNWVDCEYWPERGDTKGNHSAAVWIGGDYRNASQSTFRCGVVGMHLNLTKASQAHWDRRISGVSSKHGVEEQTVINDVSVEYASGFAFGFARHRLPLNLANGVLATRAATPFALSSTVNGLLISNFHITGPCHVDTVGIHLSPWTYQCKVFLGTIDYRLNKSVSGSHASTTLHANADASRADLVIVATAYPDPRTASMIAVGGAASYHNFADFAAVAQGYCSFENMHIEGSCIGIYVKESSGGPNTVSIDCVEGFTLTDRSRGAVFTFDGMSGADMSTTPYINNGATRANLIPQAANDWKGFGTTVLIGGSVGDPAKNDRDVVNLRGVSANGAVFVFRDQSFGHNLRSFGIGLVGYNFWPVGVFYVRGNTQARTRDNRVGSNYAAIGAGTYATGPQPLDDDFCPPTVAAHNTSRQFFIGPIY